SVRAPEHEAAPLRVDPEEVAVPPDAGELLEVGLEIAAVVWIVPEAQRHRGHGLGEHELANLVDDALAAGVEGLGRDAKLRRLDLARTHRERRHTADEPRAAVSAAAAVGDPEVLL